jgi:hypothetical protein
LLCLWVAVYAERLGKSCTWSRPAVYAEALGKSCT